MTVAIMALPFAASSPTPPFSWISSEGCFCDNVGRPCILFRLSSENSVNAVSWLFFQGRILLVGNCRENAEFCTSVFCCCFCTLFHVILFLAQEKGGTFRGLWATRGSELSGVFSMELGLFSEWPCSFLMRVQRGNDSIVFTMRFSFE